MLRHEIHQPGTETGFSWWTGCCLFVPIGFIRPTVKQWNQYHQLLPLKPQSAVTDWKTDHVKSATLGTARLSVPIEDRSLNIH